MCTPILLAAERTPPRLDRFRPQYFYINAPGAQLSWVINDENLSRLILEMLHLHTAIFLLAFVIALPFLHRRYILKYAPRNRRIIDFHTATSFLQESNLVSRANANRHLRDAFGIMNPFVNGETCFHDQFVRC